MRTRTLLFALLLVSSVSLAGCGESPKSGPTEPAAKLPPPPPADHIVVDHILIGVRSPSFAQGKRTAVDARTYAHELFQKLQAGGDWDGAKRENSEDGPPGHPGGPYAMANRGVEAAVATGEFKRDGMVPAFGDVGFTLNVGEIGIADYDLRTSPFGYHIIKRVR